MPTLGVILLNLGGPNSLDDVQPFLENLFNDPEIIDFPLASFFRKPLARFISKRRAETVKLRYAEIGGKSPIVERTREQAATLERRLNDYYAGRIKCIVEIGMRYWHPFTADAIARFHREKVTDVFLLPMYPHYSCTTSGSSFKEWRDLQRQTSGPWHVSSSYSYHVDRDFITALNERIDEGLAAMNRDSREPVHLLFSAHGTPIKIVERGDPYSRHVRQTVDALMNERGNDIAFSLSYQSKVGPAKWLEPDTVAKTTELARMGVRRILVVPVAFVSDHIETLHELDIELRHHAAAHGITEFRVAPALNASETFIRALTGIVTRKMDKVFARRNQRSSHGMETGG